jgi:hypothetical protein
MFDTDTPQVSSPRRQTSVPLSHAAREAPGPLLQSRESHEVNQDAMYSGQARRDPERLSREASRRSTAVSASKSRWWRIHFFRGMMHDIKRRAPFFVSDWTDAWDYRVVPATVYMFFAK